MLIDKKKFGFISSTRNAAIWFFMPISFFILSSCQTGTCPNCVNAKPEYYNVAKAKEARRTMHRNSNTSATGGKIDSYLDEPKKKEKRKSEDQTSKKQKPIL